MKINVEFDYVFDLIAAAMEADLEVYQSHLPTYVDEYGNIIHVSGPSIITGRHKR